MGVFSVWLGGWLQTFSSGGQHSNLVHGWLGLFKVANMFEAASDGLEGTHNGPGDVKAH